MAASLDLPLLSKLFSLSGVFVSLATQTPLPHLFYAVALHCQSCGRQFIEGYSEEVKRHCFTLYVTTVSLATQTLD